MKPAELADAHAARRPRVPRGHPAGPVQRRCSSSPGCCTATPRCAVSGAARTAPALPAARARRRLLPRRGGGVPVHAADDRLPGAGRRRRGDRRLHAADGHRRRTTATCSPTCHELGITEVYRIGGAQAIAAMAYGVDGLEAGGHDRRARATSSSPWPRSTSSGRSPSTASPGRARSWSRPTTRPTRTTSRST